MRKENKAKIKNIALIIIMFILIVLGINIISNAKNWREEVPSVKSVKNGDEFRLSYTEYDKYKTKLFCIQDQEHLAGGEYHNYTVKRIIEIYGDSASNENGKTVNSANGWNARLAYVIHKTKEKENEDKDKGKDIDIEPRRRAIWYYFPKWVKHVGSELGIKEKWTKDTNKGLKGVPSKEEIDEYIKKVKDIDKTDVYVKQKATDEEPTAKLPTSSEYREKYVKVGPFKLAFSPKLASMTIEGVKPNGDSVTINNEDIRFVTGGRTYEKIGELESNQEFSILIPIEKRIARITNIKVETEHKSSPGGVISAEIAILTTESGIQNFAIIETDKSNDGSTNDSLNMDLDISTLVDIIITKVNSQNTSERLPDVGFKLYHKQLNRWVRQTDGRTTYVENESSATTFKTNGMRDFNRGQKTINDLLLGDYTFVETEQPDNRFEMASKDFTLSSNSTTVLNGLLVPIEVPNDPIGGMLIEKVDESNESIKIPGVKFKLRNMNLPGKQWIYLTKSGEIEYVDEVAAHIFETNSSGQASVQKLAVGEYEFKEIEVPEGYECASKYFTVTEGDVNSQSTIKYTIKNKPIGDGGILIEKVDEENQNIKIPGVKFKLRNTSLPGKQWVYKLISGEITYVDEVAATEFCTDQYGRAKISKLEPGDYEFYETEVPDDYECVSKYFTITEDQSEKMEMETIPYTITNKKKEKDPVTIIIEKVDSNNQNIKLSGVGFKLRYIQDNKWIYQDSSGETTYVDSESSATTFYIDQSGQKTINNLYEGDYEFKEVIQPYYGYECISKNFIVKSSSEATIQYFTITNKQEKIKLSGRVWLDRNSGKQSVPNDLYMTNYHYKLPEYVDDSDEPIGGVTVKLMKNGVAERTTVTAQGKPDDPKTGTYEFDGILVDELNNYYIEFEYNGLIYTNVDPHLDHDNGSKAIEGGYARDEFNKGFDYIENGGSQTKGVTKDESGNVVHKLDYDINNHTAVLGKNSKDINNEEFRITANTEASEHNLYDEYIKQKNNSTTPIDCVEHNNLGIREREQPDVALVKDIQSIKIIANGKIHVYEYASRFDSQNPDKSDRFGIEYGSKFKEDVYERPVYKEDYNCAVRDGNPTQFEVYITYKIALRNESTNLVTQVNSIVDYYDSRYEIEKVGNKYTSKSEGDQVENENNAIGEYNNPGEDINKKKYKKTVINLNDMKIPHEENRFIYVQFKLNKEGIRAALNEDGTETDLYKNIAEINSYSTYDKDGKIYAGIDEDSAPGNIVLGDTSTYEDDVDIAPAMKLKIIAERKMQGKVFLDQTTGELRTGEIREGDGECRSDDKPIQGVEILLKELSGSKNEYKATTGPNGEFKIEDYIAGDYTLTYTWGGQTVDGVPITLQNYKATVYKDRKRQDNKKWHLLTDKRYSDALDDMSIKEEYGMSTREYIDSQLKTLINNSGKGYDADKTTKMESITPEMNIEVEYDTLISTGDAEHIYEVKNIDFGIVRRAKQSVKLEKRVSKMTITLANGQVVSEVEIDKKGGTLGGNEIKHITYMGPLNASSPGFVKAELDNELLQGSKVEVTYELKFKNISEVDIVKLAGNAENYNNYYNYGSDAMSTVGNVSLILNGRDTGKKVDKNEVVTITPVEIVDYLDRSWGYEESQNKERGKEWTAKTKEEFKKQYIRDESGNIIGLISDNVINDNESEINDRIILVTNQWSEQKVMPASEVIANLKVSKTLTTTEEILLGNETETVKLKKTGGSEIIEEDGSGPKPIIPGSHVPGKDPEELDTDEAEEVIVTPSTGANLEFVIPITISVIALVILGTGIVLIKKKVIDSNNKSS